jgi:uncharacterized protein YuzE
VAIYIRFDPEADAVAVDFRPRSPGDVARTQQIDERRLVDYDAAGQPLGVEFLFVSDGVDLEGVPHADEVRRALAAFPTLSRA